MPDLPAETVAKAYRAANGEFAWRCADINEAIEAVCRSGQAIIGWEVWVVLMDGRWTGLIPARDGQVPIVCSISSSYRGTREPWAEYCERVARETARQIDEQDIESCAAPEVRSLLFYNLCYEPEPETLAHGR